MIITTTLKATMNFDEYALRELLEARKLDLTSNKPSHGGRTCSEEEITVSPITNIRGGNYQFTLRNGLGKKFIIGTSEVINNIPTNEVTISVFLSRVAADLVVMSFGSGTSISGSSSAIGWNYNYDFLARTTPYTAKIGIDWNKVYEYTRNKFGFESLVSKNEINKIVRKLIKDKAIRFKIEEGNINNSSENITKDITKVIIARLFKAYHPQPESQSLKLQPFDPNWLERYILGFNDDNTGLKTGSSAAYNLKYIPKTERVKEVFEINTTPVQLVSATAGIQIPDYCVGYWKELFSYEGKFNPETKTYKTEYGCPTETYAERPGYEFEIQPRKGGSSVNSFMSDIPKEDLINSPTILDLFTSKKL